MIDTSPAWCCASLQTLLPGAKLQTWFPLRLVFFFLLFLYFFLKSPRRVPSVHQDLSAHTPALFLSLKGLHITDICSQQLPEHQQHRTKALSGAGTKGHSFISATELRVVENKKRKQGDLSNTKRTRGLDRCLEQRWKHLELFNL